MSALQREKEKIKAKLWRLKSLQDVDPRTLNGKVKEDFEDINRYITILAGQHAYAELYELIRDAFGNEIPVMNNTVSQYLSDQIKMSNAGNYCPAGQSSNSRDSSNDVCQKRIYNCIYDSQNGYLFIPKTNVKSREAYLYLLEFHGFTKTEINNLRKQGLEKVHIYNFQEVPFVDVKTPQTLTELEQNHLRIPAAQPKRDVEKSDSAMMFLILILVGLLFLFLIFAYLRKKKTG